MNLKQEYKELLALTQLYLCRESTSQQLLTTSPSLFAYFSKTMKMPPQPVKREFLPPPVIQNPQPKAPPPPPVAVEKKPVVPPPPREVNLEPIQKKQTTPLLAEFRKNYQKLFPEMAVSETIPSDERAIKLKNSWQLEQNIPPVIILAFVEQENQLNFLKNVAHAITLRFAPARVLSASHFQPEIHSQHLQLIIASDYGLYSHPELMKVYREVPQEGKHFINNIPLLLLSDLSLYLKEPQLKSLLWRAICNEFASRTKNG